MKKLNSLCRFTLCAALLMLTGAVSVRASLSYWDPQGTGGGNPYTGDLSGTWEDAKWSSVSTGSVSTTTFSETDTPAFSVNTGATTPAYTITMNANHTVLGIFCGFNAGISTNTITGTGILTVGTSAAEAGFNLTSGSSLTINNVIAGPGIISCESSGQLYLHGNNTISGGVELGYVSAPFTGIVNFNNNSSFGVGPIIVNQTGGATVGLVAEGASALTIPNNINWTTTNAGVNIVGNAAGITFSGPVTLGGSATNVNIGVGGTGNLVILSGNISGGSGNGKLNVFNQSTLRLAGANTFLNQLTISNGVLQIGNNAAITNGSSGKNVVVESPGVLDINGFSPSINGLTQTTTGGIVTNSTGTGTLTLGNNNATATFTGSIGNASGSTLNVTKVGTGTETLSGVSTYSGTTTISAGTLKVGVANALPSTSLVSVGSAGTLSLNNLADTIQSLSGAGTNSLGSGTLTLSSTAGETISGPITGTGTIIVAGGTGVTLSGANTYTGTLTVSNGSVVVGAANTLPSGSTLNISGGTLNLQNSATVKVLKFDGITKPAGTYGTTGSGANFENGSRFVTGTALLTVTTGSTSTSVITADHQSVVSGQQVTFTVTVTGAGGDGSNPTGSVTLYDNGVSVATGTLTASTGTSSTVTFPPMTLSVGAHPMTATWGGNTSYAGSTAAVFSEGVVVQPVITAPTSPTNATVDAGTTVNFSVTVQDATSIGYQWQKGGVNLNNGAYANASTVSGTTSATLTLTSVRAADAASYTCIVSNAAGTQTSTTFALAVNDPAIAVQPASSVFECGTTPSLTVTAYGTTNNLTGRLLYQWYTPNPAGTRISNATNSALPFPNFSAGSVGSYCVVVSNAFGNYLTSSVAVVTLKDTTQPVLVGVPASTTISCSAAIPAVPNVTATDSCDGTAAVTFGAVTNAGSCPQNSSIVRTWTATDTSNNSISQSQTITIVDTNGPVITLTNGSPINTECHVAYVDPGYSASDACAGSVSVTVSGNLNTNTLGTYTLTYTAVDPCNNTNKATRVVHVVDTVGPVITILGNNPDTACYLSGGYDDPGATANDACSGPAAVVTNNPVNTSVLGTYTVTYSSLDVNSNLRTVTRVVHVVTCGPVITHDLPSTASVTLGGSITLSITAESLAPITYQWYKFGGSLSGQTNSSLVITNASGVNFGNYYCAVTAGSYTSNSTTCALSIKDPGINSQSGDIIVVAGGTTNLTVDAGGTAPLTYHWFRNGIPLKNTTTFIGAFLPSLTLSKVSQNSVGGDYTCWITNGNGASIVTSPARVTVYDPPVVKIIPPTSKLTEGQDVTLSVKITKGGTNTTTTPPQIQPLGFHWYFQGVNQGSPTPLLETSSQLALHQVTTNNSGTYSCVVTNYTGSLTNGSNICIMTVSASKPPAGVTLLKPNDMGTKAALTQGTLIVDALTVKGGTGPNAAPTVDISGTAHDNGLLVSVVLSNAPDTNVIPMTFVNKDTLGTGTTPTPAAPIVKKAASFSVHTTLHDGTNALTAYVTDYSGNVSTNPKPRLLYYMGSPSTLTIQTNGSGKTGSISAVQGPTTKIWGIPANGATLEMGQAYTLQAKGAPGTNVLVQWDMSDANGPLPSVPGNNTSTATLNFIMSSNLTISAKYQNGH